MHLRHRRVGNVGHFFFYKQKTAYEMRISDWSSDVCSSDLTLHLPPGDWPTVLDCLCAHFPAISRATWLDRIARGRVLDAQRQPIDAAQAYRVGRRSEARRVGK